MRGSTVKRRKKFPKRKHAVTAVRCTDWQEASVNTAAMRHSTALEIAK